MRSAACFPATASTSRCSATACRAASRTCARPSQLAARLRLPVVATHGGAVPRPPTTTSAHEARVCVAEGEMLANPRRVKRFSREQYFKTAGADGAAVRRPAERARQHGRDRQALQPRAWCSASRSCPTSRRRESATRRCRWPSTSGSPRTRASRSASAQLYPDPAERERERPRYVDAARLRDRDDPEDGLPGLLPDRRRLHQLGQAQRLPGRAGPRLGRRLAGGLLAATSPTSIRSRYDLLFERFLNPERVSMPDFDIDFCQANRDRVIDYVKHEVRSRRGEPDRHLRHDGGEGRAARHRPRARHELRPCRLASQSSCRRRRQDDRDAAAPRRDDGEKSDGGVDLRAPRGARDRAAREERGGGRRAAGARPSASRASCATSACTPAAC